LTYCLALRNILIKRERVTARDNKVVLSTDVNQGFCNCVTLKIKTPNIFCKYYIIFECHVVVLILVITIKLYTARLYTIR
jgi:hypothetical protein